jgi:hypothetical protein
MKKEIKNLKNEINNNFGLELEDKDMYIFSQILEGALNNKELQKSFENGSFEQDFNNMFDSIVNNTKEQNEKMEQKLLEDDDFFEKVSNGIMVDTYNKFRNK